MHLFYVLLCLSSIYVSGQDPALVLPQGRIVGIKVYPKKSVTPVEIYFGIPYAISPTGRYRFSAPERFAGWRRTFFAHRIPPRCPQAGDTENDFFSEDCLFLNIWTPRRADGKPLPVIVILYSESWSRAAVTSLPCEELAAEGAVVVTVAYRLHLLGFFTLRSMLARGNYGLLDQYLALVWIRENIAVFGGDPAAVTLMGHSAGADSVLSHIASQRSLGLFQRAIIMSPRYLWRTIVENNETHVETDVESISRQMAREIGCYGSDEEIVKCLRDQPLADIMRTYKNSSWSDSMHPVVDTFLPESEQYLPKSLSAALSSSKQPSVQLDLLIGAADLESINFNNNENYEELSRLGAPNIKEYSYNNAIPELLRTLSLQVAENHVMLNEAVRWEFWGASAWSEKGAEDGVRSAECLARAQSSVQWGVGTALLAARLARRVSRLHVYRYTQPAGVDLRGRELNYTGAAHGTDLIALLGDAMLLQVARRPASADERRISTLMRRYFINFVKFGSPSSDNEWPRYKAGEAFVKDIRDHGASCVQQQADTSRHVAFWLQYLPQLSSLLSSPERTEQLTIAAGESRLRGGIFAMCGVTIILLLLLCISVVLLWERRRHSLEDI